MDDNDNVIIEKLDPSDGRYTTIITKVNELIDAVNTLLEDYQPGESQHD